MVGFLYLNPFTDFVRVNDSKIPNFHVVSILDSIFKFYQLGHLTFHLMLIQILILDHYLLILHFIIIIFLCDDIRWRGQWCGTTYQLMG